MFSMIVSLWVFGTLLVESQFVTCGVCTVACFSRLEVYKGSLYHHDQSL